MPRERTSADSHPSDASFVPLLTAWPLIAVLLMLSSAAQQIGTSALVLLLLKTLRWSPEALSSLWATVGTTVLAVPLLGAVSDAWASTRDEAQTPSPTTTRPPEVRERGVVVDDDKKFPMEEPNSNLAETLRRREVMSGVTCALAAIAFIVLWTLTARFSVASPSTPSDGAVPPPAASSLMIVVVVVGLTLVQSLQSAVLNGWLVDAEKLRRAPPPPRAAVRGGLQADANGGSATVSAYEGDKGEPQSWAMVRRSAGSLAGGVLETILFSSGLVLFPATMMLLCAAMQCAGCCAVMVTHVTAAPQRLAQHGGRLYRQDHHVRVLSLLRQAKSFVYLVVVVCRSRIAAMRSTSGHNSIYTAPLVLVLLITSMPSPASAYTAYVAQTLHYSNALLALNGTVGLASALVAVVVFRGTVSSRNHSDAHRSATLAGATTTVFSPCWLDAPLCRAFVVASLVSALAVLSNLVLVMWQLSLGPRGSQLYLLLDESVMAFAARWVYMPVLVLAARVAADGEQPTTEEEEEEEVSAVIERDCNGTVQPPRTGTTDDVGGGPATGHRRVVPSTTSSAFMFEFFVVVGSVGGIVGSWSSAALTFLLMPSGGGGLDGPSSSTAGEVVAPRQPTGLASLIVVCAAWRLAPAAYVVYWNRRSNYVVGGVSVP